MKSYNYWIRLKFGMKRITKFLFATSMTRRKHLIKFLKLRPKQQFSLLMQIGWRKQYNIYLYISLFVYNIKCTKNNKENLNND